MPRCWSVAVALAGILAACGSSGSTGAEPADSTTSSSAPTTASAQACGDSESSCTPAQVIARLTSLYEEASATPVEAACLAPITGKDAHSVSEGFDAVSPDETRAAIACVGSEARLRKIANGLRFMAAQRICDDAPADARKLPEFVKLCGTGGT